MAAQEAPITVLLDKVSCNLAIHTLLYVPRPDESVARSLS